MRPSWEQFRNRRLMQSAHTDAGHGSHDDHIDQDELKTFGFWIFLMTDVVIFACLFATFIVLRDNTVGLESLRDLVEMPGVIAETFILLTSSFTSGLAVLAMNRGDLKWLVNWLVVTIALGAAFLFLEVSEFQHFVHEGATLSTSAHWSAFYTLVGTHGIHVTIGFFWILGLIFQLRKQGITSETKRKVTITSLYWHFLDVIWIFVFTIVYMMEVM